MPVIDKIKKYVPDKGQYKTDDPGEGSGLVVQYVPNKGQYKTDDPGEGSSLVIRAGHW